MTDDLKEISLNEIIDDLVASESTLDAAALGRWIKLYPRYERELMDFAARWSLMTHLPPDDSPLPDEAGFYSRGLELVKKIMSTGGSGGAGVDLKEEPLSSILAE